MLVDPVRFPIRRWSVRLGALTLPLVLLMPTANVGRSIAVGAEAAAPIGWNSVGYLPHSPKQATIAGNAENFLVVDAQTGNEVLRGRLAPLDTPTGKMLIADFSSVDQPGEYELVVPGVGRSGRFRIASDIFNWPLYCGVRGMYLWRCGCAVEGTFGGDTYRHAACHTEDAWLDHAGGPPGQRRDGVGGWHDAGDYNKYTVNGAFTAGMMLRAWEDFSDRLKSLKFDIPESNNAVPDFLDEVRWEIDWLLKMQADDGRAWHKLSALEFDGFELPEEETARRYLSPWGTAATADLAAVLAQAARVFRPYDAEYADRLLIAAKKSYDALESYPADHRPDLSAFATGPYQSPDSDDRIWAAAELWETTGDSKYLRDFEQRISSAPNDAAPSPPIVDTDWDWGNVRNLGTFTYLRSQHPGRDPALLARIRQQAIAAADAIVETAQRDPHRRTLGSTYYWGCNGTVVRQAMNLHLAQLLTGDKKYEAAMLDALNHVLGRNPYGRSYVTGLGHRPPLYPHDRRSGGDNVAAPWPGYLVGGPWPTADDWHDQQDDYRTNETAINWNGALIYALAAFVESDTFAASVAASQRTDDRSQEQRGDE